MSRTGQRVWIRLAFVLSGLAGMLLACSLAVGQNDAMKNSSVIDADGTAHVTRVVPVPDTVSAEAQQFLRRKESDANRNASIAQRRARGDARQASAGKAFEAMYPVRVGADTIAGVPVRVVTPLTMPEANRSRVLINIHGGGFVVDVGSLTETVPIANLTQTKVISVLYRMAPEHPFPAAVDDVVAVYKKVLKTYKPERIAIYGTSAGAILTGEVASRLKQLGLPMPGALGIFSGMGDFSRFGDSQSLFGPQGLSGHLDLPSKPPFLPMYVGTTNPRDPVLSPVFADVHGFPPTLLISSERDMLLSGTTILHRKFLEDGVDARLVVFEALPHAFWNNPELPESKEAVRMMANFFDRELGK